MNINAPERIISGLSDRRLKLAHRADQRRIKNTAEDVRLKLSDYHFSVYRSESINIVHIGIGGNHTSLAHLEYTDCVALRALSEFSRKRGYLPFDYRDDITHTELSKSDDLYPDIALYFQPLGKEAVDESFRTETNTTVRQGLTVAKHSPTQI